MKTELEGAGAQYAEAILELATKKGEAPDLDEKVSSDLKAINEVIRANPDLNIVLNHPSVLPEDKKKFVVNLFSGLITDLTLRLVELLCDKRRLELLPSIEKRYHTIMNVRKNIVTASLTSSEKISETMGANVKARLAEHIGKKLELEVKVDKSLLGGVVLRIGDQVIDGSLKGKLDEIEKALLAV
jgi:F-type H+-transporting ATPase subunit delta